MSRIVFLISFVLLAQLSFAQEGTKDYHFDGKICEEVLRNYLSRAITMAEVCTAPKYKIDGKDNAVEEDIRFIKNTGWNCNKKVDKILRPTLHF